MVGCVLLPGDFTTENLRYKATEKYSFGVTSWRAVAGSAQRLPPFAIRTSAEWLRLYKQAFMEAVPGGKRAKRRARRRLPTYCPHPECCLPLAHDGEHGPIPF